MGLSWRVALVFQSKKVGGIFVKIGSQGSSRAFVYAIFELVHESRKTQLMREMWWVGSSGKSQANIDMWFRLSHSNILPTRMYMRLSSSLDFFDTLPLDIKKNSTTRLTMCWRSATVEIEDEYIWRVAHALYKMYQLKHMGGLQA